MHYFCCGLVLREDNVELLKENGKIVYLRAAVETLAERLNGDTTRPLLQKGEENLTEKLTKLLEARAPIYEAVADFIVDVDGKMPEEIVDEIMEKMEEDNKMQGACTR